MVATSAASSGDTYKSTPKASSKEGDNHDQELNDEDDHCAYCASKGLPCHHLRNLDRNPSLQYTELKRVDSSFQESMRFLVASATDESGAWESVVTGLGTLFVIGTAIGFFSYKNPALPTLWYRYCSAIIGYIYFLAWTLSFYPQVYSNYRRRSTKGLSSDFCAINVLGFACYAPYTAAMYWSTTVRAQYRERHGTENTVQSNDVAFAVNALIMSTVTMLQVVYYRDAKGPSNVILTTIVMFLAVIVYYGVLVYNDVASWLDYLYVLSYIKVAITVIKYIPQVVVNFKRKSTVGWSVWFIVLDFTGGVLSEVQLVLDSVDIGDLAGITGNLAKLGLGFVSIAFDIVFMVQHYILYREIPKSLPEASPLFPQEEGNQRPKGQYV